MVSFSRLDILIVVLFFITNISIGIWAGRKTKNTSEDYLLSSRKLNLFLFVLTTVSAWYGGILGIGEFTYNYGLLSWFTQGLPYYICAFIFAVFFSKKIRKASLFTIPEKISEKYGRTSGLIAALVVFVLVSPAPYLMMVANLFALIFNINILLALLMAFLLSSVYLVNAGFKGSVYVDSFQFFIMFSGFIVITVLSYFNYGGVSYLQKSLPAEHLTLTHGQSTLYIVVWFLIAMWTFTDPGFHQRCYAAKTGDTARKGILISIGFWIFFDFMTTSTGLYARAALPNLNTPSLSFPLYGNKILSSGLKGLFFSGLFATILSTLNSFLFLSGSTFTRDFVYKLFPSTLEKNVRTYTITGLISAGIVGILIAYYVQSVIQIWYLIGSICIPIILFAVVSSYYTKLLIPKKVMIVQMILVFFTSIFWQIFRQNHSDYWAAEIEPMIIGLIVGVIIHLYGLLKRQNILF